MVSGVVSCLKIIPNNDEVGCSVITNKKKKKKINNHEKGGKEGEEKPGSELT